MTRDEHFTSDEAEALMRDSIVWDMTMPWGTWGDGRLKPVALSRLRNIYTVASLTLAGDDTDTLNALHAVAEERARIRADADTLLLIEGIADVERCRREGKLGISFHFQGTVPIGHNLDLIEVFYKLGIRHMLMAYNQKNFVGDGCHERTDGGLSHFGVALIEEMDRVGMLIDVSHTGFRTSMEVFEAARGPVIFSHSNPKAIFDHPRNIADEQIKACAASGGVIGVNGVGIFLGSEGASAEAIFRCVDYLAETVGPEFVGLGLDTIYDLEGIKKLREIRGRRAYPADGGYESEVTFATPEQVRELIAIMLARGYSQGQIQGILGENWIRVCGQVWN